ncbi:MAG: hypothetical protein R3B47_05490 [Bacteroidia bacterium]
MKIIISLILFCGIFSAVYSQNIPVDFEPNGNGASWTWDGFENDSNPHWKL